MIKKCLWPNVCLRGVLLIIICVTLLSGCTSTENATDTLPGNDIFVEYDEEDLNASWDASTATAITLNGQTITASSDSVNIEVSKATITGSGTYVVSGTLDDGQIIVDSADDEVVRLVLAGANITCLDNAPIYVLDAKKVVLILAEGTENHITDGTEYVLADAASDEPNAAIFSKSDMTVNGSGALFVDANYNNGITAKDELKIVSGSITVDAAADGIRGRDFLAVRDGVIVVNAVEDGFKSNNDEDAAKGFVLIEGGTIDITSGEDGIQAETNILISDGEINIISGGGSANGVNTKAGTGGGRGQDIMGGFNPGGGRPSQNSTGGNEAGSSVAENILADTTNNTTAGDTATEEESTSMKGIKASVDITITGGVINIDSADDAIHSNDSINLSGGTITIASGDDGIHADTNMTVDGGNITISKSYEGMESALITINDGEMHLTSSDDGINVAGGNDSSSLNGRPGANNFNSSGSDGLSINGGYVVIDASGDGIDVNGSMAMTAGTVLVSGPTSNGNGALDYNGSFDLSGGLLVAAGSSGMAQSPSSTSRQYAVSINFDSMLEAGTVVHIETSDGDDILTFKPAKAYQSLVFSSPALAQGFTYKIYYGGTANGNSLDELYEGGSYSGGTEYESFTISDMVTSAGSGKGSNMGGGASGGGGPGGGRPNGGGRPDGGGEPPSGGPNNAGSVQ